MAPCVEEMIFFFSSRRRHTRLQGDWSSDVCSSDLRDAALSPRGPSRVVAAASPGKHGHLAKTANVKKGKKAKTHGRANHGLGTAQSNRAHAAGGARVHQKAKLKPKRLRLPGPIRERTAHARRHGKQK